MRIEAVTSERAQQARAPARKMAAAPAAAPATGGSSALSPSGTPERPSSSSGRQVTISFDDNKTVYRFIDSNSGKILQQIPPAELLRVMHNIGEWLQEAKKKVDLKS
jgi:hypothetical protein